MKKVLVTGGTGHIGKAIVKRFLDNGYFVYIHGSNDTSLEKFACELTSCKSNYETVAYDVSCMTDESMIEKVDFESIDILINAIGGGGSHESWSETSLSKWRSVYNLNVVAPVFFIKKVIQTMKNKAFGRVVNIASVSASKTLNIGPEYSSAKSAVVNFSQSLAQEFKNKPVTVNCISPGLVYTDMVRHVMCETYDINLEAGHDVINKVISERFYPNLVMGLPSVDEISGLVWYLCGEQAKHITGQNFIIDSGYSLCDYVKGSVE